MGSVRYGTALGRAMRLKCPRCGQGPLFRGFLTMHRACTGCGFVYERDPGFFLGSTYLNYGFTSLTLTALYMGLHFGLGWSNEALAGPLLAYCVIVPLILFRYARAWWLAMDSCLDTTGMQELRPPTVEPEPPHVP